MKTMILSKTNSKIAQIEKKKEEFLGLINIVKKEIDEFSKFYQGPGIKRKIKRLIHYKTDYLRYSLAKLGILKSYQFVSRFGLINSGLRELKSLEYFIRNIKESDVFYDIGSYHGLFPVVLSYVFNENIEIHCFEPIPDNFKILSKNLSSRSNIFLNNFALLDYKGQIEFNIPKKSFLLSSSTITEEGAKKYLKNYYKVKVKCDTLDSYILNHKPPTFIKMDVEGSEMFVIKGGLDLFRKFSPKIIMEVQTGEIGMNYSLEAIKELVNLGYSIFRIDDYSNNIEEINVNKMINFIQSRLEINEDNFLFLKK